MVLKGDKRLDVTQCVCPRLFLHRLLADDDGFEDIAESTGKVVDVLTGRGDCRATRRFILV